MTTSKQRIREIQKMRCRLTRQKQLTAEKLYMPAMPPYLLVGDICAVYRKIRKAVKRRLRLASRHKTLRIETNYDAVGKG